MTDCDCTGSNARVNGECRVLVEFRVIGIAQERHGAVKDDLEGYRRAGVKVTPEVLESTRKRHGADREGIEALQREHGLRPYAEQYRQRVEERERDGDGQGMEWRLQRLGVPTRALVDLRHFHDTPATDAAKKAQAVPAEMCPFLALMGETGQGKTVAAAWFFREAARRTSPDVPTGTSPPLVWTAGSRFTGLSAFDDADRRFLEECRKARLLVVDELGHDATPIGATAIRDLLLQRESNGRRTVLTSNLGAAEFREKYGAALLDRLLNRGVCVNLKGKSMRRAVP